MGDTCGKYDREWIKINHATDEIPKAPFLLTDEHGYIHVGDTARDYYDSVYWFPIPKYPFQDCIITNDRWVSLMNKKGTN